MQRKEDNLRLYVQNTFLHVKGADEEPQKLNRSRSDSSISLPASSSESTLTGSRHSSNEGTHHHVIWGPVEASSVVTDSSGQHCMSPHSNDDGSKRHEGPVLDSVEFLSTSDCSSSRSGSAKLRTEAEAVQAELHVQLLPLGSSPLPASAGGEPEDAISIDNLQQFPSVGSVKHSKGTCKPCMFAHSRVGCSKGLSCPWCHYSHKNSKRPCKSKRDHFRKLIAQAEGKMFGEQG
mmetsp:Transcript_128927/g.248386  ORF Transcript_128927/g.248386 Transcript_128927/m.248386 type:complete len:234 (+) Transcript_128927:76-777(+)